MTDTPPTPADPPARPSLHDLVTRGGHVLGPDGTLWTALGLRDRTKAAAMAARVAADDVSGMVHHRREIAAALGVTMDAVDAACAESRRRARAREDAALRAAFVPHAVVDCGMTRPRQITIAAITGGNRMRLIPLPRDMPPIRWPAYVRARLPPLVYGWGRPRGFVIAYHPDRAVRFDLRGRPVATLSSGLRLWSDGSGDATRMAALLR